MSKKNRAYLIEYFLLQIPGDPSHAVMLQKYFIHLSVKSFSLFNHFT